MAITIDDIARQAGVSKMTVSRVINNSPNVSPATRKKIQAIIEKTGYNANLFAQTLAKKESLNLVGLIISVSNLFSSYYFIEVLKYLESFIEARGYNLFIFNLLDKSIPDMKKKLDIISSFYQSGIISSVILFGPPINDGRISFLSQKGVKGIIIGSRWKDKNFGSIDIDNKKGVRELITYLVKCNHKRIAIIKGPDNLTPALEREQSFFKVLKENNIAVNEEYIKEGYFGYDGGRIAAQQLFSLPELPTAVFAANDDMAFGAYDAAREKGLKIPEDISIVGFDNIDTAATVQPGLTTFGQPFQEIGELAAKAIINKQFDIKLRIPGKLIIRDSVLCL